MKNILILGGSSEIGINLISKLLKKNLNIFAHYSTKSKNLKSYKNKKLKLIRLNFDAINNKNVNNKLKKKFNFKYDVIINLIGYIDKKSFERAW